MVFKFGKSVVFIHDRHDGLQSDSAAWLGGSRQTSDKIRRLYAGISEGDAEGFLSVVALHIDKGRAFLDFPAGFDGVFDDVGKKSGEVHGFDSDILRDVGDDIDAAAFFHGYTGICG